MSPKPIYSCYGVARWLTATELITKGNQSPPQMQKKNLITHLGFTDDLIIFCKVGQGSVYAVKACIVQFATAIALLINPSKTHMLMGSIPRAKDEILASILNVKQVTAPINYLGLPLVAGRLLATDCLPLIEKATSKIRDWKNRFLSHAGRLKLTM